MPAACPAPPESPGTCYYKAVSFHAFEKVNVAVLSVFKSQLRESPALTKLLLGFGCNRRLVAFTKGASNCLNQNELEIVTQ